MSFESIRLYEEERRHIIAELEERLPDGQPAIIQGSVARAFGPFSDVDALTVGATQYWLSHGPISGTKVQEHLFSPSDFEDFVYRSGRGLTAIVDGVFLNSAGDNEKTAHAKHLFDKQRAYLRTAGRGDLVALLLAEHEGDTQRPDILFNHSRYALKRSNGGKRSTTRSYIMALVMHDEPILDGEPYERITSLMEAGMINEDVLSGMFAVNALLGRLWRNGSFTTNDWDTSTRITKNWNFAISEFAKDFIQSNLSPDHLQALHDASSASPTQQRRAIEFAQLPSTNGIKSRSILWRLAANYTIDTEVLYKVWEICETQPRILREIGCTAVQLPQFQSLGISPDSKLLNDPDVKFSLTYALQEDTNPYRDCLL